MLSWLSNALRGIVWGEKTFFGGFSRLQNAKKLFFGAFHVCKMPKNFFFGLFTSAKCQKTFFSLQRVRATLKKLFFSFPLPFLHPRKQFAGAEGYIFTLLLSGEYCSPRKAYIISLKSHRNPVHIVFIKSQIIGSIVFKHRPIVYIRTWRT